MKEERKPEAICLMRGSDEYRSIRGVVSFMQQKDKILVRASFKGLPVKRMKCSQSIMGLHIHEKGECSGDRNDPFKNAMGHYNPNECAHPYHAGDLGNLFVNKDGTALMCMSNDRFTIREITGKSIILHLNLDDFTTQPAGNSGKRIACGIIRKY